MDKFLEKYNLPKLKEAQVESLSSPITADKLEAVIKNSQHTKALDQMVSQENSFYKAFKEDLTRTLHRHF